MLLTHTGYNFNESEWTYSSRHVVNRGSWTGVGRAASFPFLCITKRISSPRIASTILLSYILIVFLIFLWFSFFLPGNTRRWMFLYLLCSMLLLFGFCFLIRQGNPSLWRRRLRKSVRPLPAVTAGMNLMTRNQSPLIAINRRIPSTTMPTSINLPFFVSVSANSLIECE